MKISIIEDDYYLWSKLTKKIKRNWYNVCLYNSKNELLSNHKIESDLYIIDLNLWISENDWFEIISWLRQAKKINSPIIITSGYSDLEKKVYWLDLWADDYLAKPYSPEELLARIRSLLRRNSNEKSSIIRHKNIEYDLKNWVILSNKYQNINFTKRELMIIEYFIINKNKVVKRNDLTISIWWSYDGIWISDNTINVTLCNLRKKIGSDFDLITLNWKWYILKD